MRLSPKPGPVELNLIMDHGPVLEVRTGSINLNRCLVGSSMAMQVPRHIPKVLGRSRYIKILQPRRHVILWELESSYLAQLNRYAR